MEIYSFSLDDKTNEFLNDKKWELRKSRSELIRLVFQHFIENPKELQKIIIGENNIE